MTTITPVETQHDRMVLGNLFELYLYDFSAIERQPLGADGRFSHPEMLQPYWGEPERHAFLISHNAAPAGFALVKRGSALAGDLEAMDLAEFFVLRGLRRTRVGSQAAQQLFDHFPTRWVVRVLAANPPALAFWEVTIGAYSQGQYVRDQVRQPADPPRDWAIFRFEASRRA